MKRWIIYMLLSVVTAVGLQAAPDSEDRGKGKKEKSSTLAMKPKKLSKHTAKNRKQVTRDRQKHMADIKRSQKKNNR
jgi:hypothetical protein